MIESVAYNEENGLWYPSRLWNGPGTEAVTYREAFEKIYGKAPEMPPLVREQSRFFTSQYGAKDHND